MEIDAAISQLFRLAAELRADIAALKSKVDAQGGETAQLSKRIRCLEERRRRQHRIDDAWFSDEPASLH